MAALPCLGGDSFRLDIGLEESALLARVLGKGMENGFFCDLIVLLLSFLVPSVGVVFFLYVFFHQPCPIDILLLFSITLR